MGLFYFVSKLKLENNIQIHFSTIQISEPNYPVLPCFTTILVHIKSKHWRFGNTVDLHFYFNANTLHEQLTSERRELFIMRNCFKQLLYTTLYLKSLSNSFKQFKETLSSRVIQLIFKNETRDETRTSAH